MKERPILFKPPMVGAIFAGEKTQTRRVVKIRKAVDEIIRPLPELCPYGVVGDRLWVRETWSCGEKKFDPVVSEVRYKADGFEGLPDGWRWRPSIHMPKAACRLRLEITEVRIERLQDISNKDAMAEGVSGCIEFTALWKSINGPASYYDNPWVWVVTFKAIP